MEGRFVKAPERTGRGRMEEGWSLSAGEWRRNGGETHPTRNSICTCLDLIFIGTQSVSRPSQGLLYSASETGLVRNQKLYLADEKRER